MIILSFKTWKRKHCQYCKFGNFRENFIFANSVKRHICQVKKSQLWHNLPTLVKNKEFSPFREGLCSRNSAPAKFRENKILAKISEFTVLRSEIVFIFSIVKNIGFASGELLQSWDLRRVNYFS